MPKGLFFALLLATAAPIAAQTDTLTPRVAKIEKELRAVQRKVFPNGETILEPEIRPDAAEPPPPGAAASAPLADLTARVDSLESQLAQMTGQAEQNSYRLRQLEDQVKALSAQADTRLKALEGGAPPAAAGNGAAPPPVRSTNPVDEPPQTNARAAQVAAVARPSTGDEADDRYIFGYRLWQAKLYPEAETELKTVVAKYPDHRRASYAQNLLGRAYMDEGKPALASVAFYDNYQKNPKGERASESLTWLGTALIRLKKPADACKVYDELQDVYGATLTAPLRALMLDGRKKAKCA